MDPVKYLNKAGVKMDSFTIRKSMVEDILLYLDADDLAQVRHWVDTRLDALSKAEEGAQWWVLETGREAEDMLDDAEKCLALGIKHHEHNPTGEEQKINCIKSIRARIECGLKEAKELAEGYVLRVKNEEAPFPVFTTLATEYSTKEEDDDIFGELI
jgi:hypothetical protein